MANLSHIFTSKQAESFVKVLKDYTLAIRDKTVQDYRANGTKVENINGENACRVDDTTYRLGKAVVRFQLKASYPMEIYVNIDGPESEVRELESGLLKMAGIDSWENLVQPSPNSS